MGSLTDFEFNPNEVKIVDIQTIIPNQNNPRYIKDDKFKKLVKSIEGFPKMMNLRPIVVNEEMVVLGGNMRLEACKKAGLKKVPIQIAEGYTKEEQDEFIVKDNVGFGSWDWEILANEWNDEKLIDWGLDYSFDQIDVDSKNEDEVTEEGEIKFSEYLSEQNNYVVLFFDNEMDWLQAQTHFELKTVSSKRANGKEWSKRIGRVINGAEYFKNLNK